MPVKNYEAEVECDTNVDILTFRALRQILRNSKDFLKDKVQKASRDIETEVKVPKNSAIFSINRTFSVKNIFLV